MFTANYRNYVDSHTGFRRVLAAAPQANKEVTDKVAIMCRYTKLALFLAVFSSIAATAQSGPYLTRQQGPNYTLYGNAQQVPAQKTIQDKFGVISVSPLYQYDTSVTSLEEAQYRLSTNTQSGYSDPNLPAGLGSHAIKVWFTNGDLDTQTPAFPNGGVAANHVAYPLVGSAATKELMGVGTPTGNVWKGNWLVDGATGGNVNGGSNPQNLLQMAKSAPMYELFHNPDLTVYDLEAIEFGQDNEGDVCGAPMYTPPTANAPNGTPTTKWNATNWACVYNEFYELTTYLLTTYNNSGKTFILQDWEADSELNEQNAWGVLPLTLTCTAGNGGTSQLQINYCQSVLNMRQWFTLRWAGVNDARRDMIKGAGYTNVTVAASAEAGDIDNYFPTPPAVQEAPTVMDIVFPYLHMDLYSCSCYYEDTIGVGSPGESSNNSLGNLATVPNATTVPRVQQMYTELNEVRATIHQPQTNDYLPNGQPNPTPIADAGPSLFGDKNGTATNSLYVSESGAKEVEYYTYDDWGGTFADPFLTNTAPIPSDQIARMVLGQEFQGALAANARYMFLWALYTNGTLSDAKPSYDSIDSLWIVRPPCNTTSDAVPGSVQAWCVSPASNHVGASSEPEHWNYLASIMPQPISTYQNTYEAENFYTGVSGPAGSEVDMQDTSATGGYASSLVNASVGSTMDYAMFLPGAGSQTVNLRVKDGPAQGQFQVYVNGSVIGGPFDTYSTVSGYATVTLGSVSLQAGENTFAVTVSGKNASATGYGLVVDNIQVGNPVPVQSFTVGVTSPLTVVAGQSGTVTVTVSPMNNFAGTVTLSCMQLPADASCSFPAGTSVTVSNGPTTLQMTINTSSANARMVPLRDGGVALCLFGVPILFLGWKKKVRVMMVVALCALAGLGGCGKGAMRASLTPAGTYSVMVQGSSGSMVSSGTLSLVVTP